MRIITICSIAHSLFRVEASTRSPGEVIKRPVLGLALVATHVVDEDEPDYDIEAIVCNADGELVEASRLDAWQRGQVDEPAAMGLWTEREIADAGDAIHAEAKAAAENKIAWLTKKAASACKR